MKIIKHLETNDHFKVIFWAQAKLYFVGINQEIYTVEAAYLDFAYDNQSPDQIATILYFFQTKTIEKIARKMSDKPLLMEINNQVNHLYHQ